MNNQPDIQEASNRLRRVRRGSEPLCDIYLGELDPNGCISYDERTLADAYLEAEDWVRSQLIQMIQPPEGSDHVSDGL